MTTIYGVDVIDPDKLTHPFSELAHTPDGWRVIFNGSLDAITRFLAAHDPFEVLAKCVHQVMVNAAYREDNPRWGAEGRYEPYELIEPAELEILQSLALAQLPPRKMVPASPGSMQRFLPEIPKCTYAFSRMQPPRYPDHPEREHLIGRIRLHTIFHRNLFVKDDCETVIRSIFRHIDLLTAKELGFAFSEMWSALIAIAAKIECRMALHLHHSRDGITAQSEAEALNQIAFFCEISTLARRSWEKCKKHCKTLDDFRGAAFPLSELCHSWAGTLDKLELRSEFGDAAVTFFERLSLRPGGLSKEKIPNTVS